MVMSRYYGKKILKRLDCNYSILISLVRLGISSIPLQEIQELGFTPSSCSEVIFMSSRCSSGRMYGIKLTSSVQEQP